MYIYCLRSIEKQVLTAYINHSRHRNPARTYRHKCMGLFALMAFMVQQYTICHIEPEIGVNCTQQSLETPSCEYKLNALGLYQADTGRQAEIAVDLF